ncbi:MAG: S-layer homology domain-containing protein, partial [Oscillospiraceae bacterium]
MLKTSGEGKGAVTWKSSNETVATVDANTGEVTINKVGSTIITATKAEDDDYLEASVTYTLKVQEKPISGTVTIDIANGKDSEESKIDKGDILTANITLIEPAEVTKDGLTYQWYRGTDKIDGETNKTYVVTDADTDKTVSVLVTPKAGGNFNGEVKSAEVEVGKELIFGSVSITGDETVGNTLTLDKTKLTPEGATFTTKWQRDGVDIAGAAKETYKLTKSDLGKTIGVVITATDKFTGSMTAIKEIPPVKPEKPVIKTTAGNGQVALTWTAPFDGGSTITGYKLTVTPSIKGSPFTIAGSATSYTVTGLTNGTKYSFILTAINQVGNTDSDAKTETPVSSTGGGSDSGGSDSGGSNSGGSNSGGSNSGGSNSGGSNSGGSNSGGSNSGGSNSGDSDNIAPNPNEPTVPTTTVTEVNPIMDKNGNANVSITDKIIDNAIKKAQDETKKNGTVANGIAVVIKVKTNKTINNLTATLPKSVQEKLIVAGVKNVTIKSGAVDIAINLDALKQMKSTTNSDVNITAIKVDNSKLSAEAKKAVGNRPIIDFKVTGTNGKTVSDFGKGSVSISVPYTLANGEKAGNVVAVYINGAGKVEYLTSSSYNTNTEKLMLATNHFSTYGVAYKADTTATTFSDIANHWAKDAISFVTARGLFTGTGNGKFSPNASMTRGMFVTALGRLVGANVSSYKKSSFTDVKTGSYYMGYVEWANKNGIVKGISATTFAPDQSITREQMADVIANYAKTIGFDMPTVYTAVTFADNAKISNNAKDSVKAMQMAGILMGKDGNLFDPQGTVTRAE